MKDSQAKPFEDAFYLKPSMEQFEAAMDLDDHEYTEDELKELYYHLSRQAIDEGPIALSAEDITETYETSTVITIIDKYQLQDQIQGLSDMPQWKRDIAVLSWLIAHHEVVYHDPYDETVLYRDTSKETDK